MTNEAIADLLLTMAVYAEDEADYFTKEADERGNDSLRRVAAQCRIDARKAREAADFLLKR